MPNGGPDCCGNCTHNRAVQESIPPAGPQSAHFRERSYCSLRNVAIKNPFWTYCRNFASAHFPLPVKREAGPSGWILANGLYEGYVRIPWDDKNEPRVSVPTTCTICGRGTSEGIEIEREGALLGFCTNRHYVQWWKTVHEDDSWKAEVFQSPEDRYKLVT